MKLVQLSCKYKKLVTHQLYCHHGPASMFKVDLDGWEGGVDFHLYPQN